MVNRLSTYWPKAPLVQSALVKDVRKKRLLSYEELITCLQNSGCDDPYKPRIRAIRRLDLLSSDDIPTIIKALDYDSDKVCHRAVCVIDAIGRKEKDCKYADIVIPALINVVSKPHDEFIRGKVAGTLETWIGKEGVTDDLIGAIIRTLTSALEDKEESVRYSAVSSLNSITKKVNLHEKAKESIPALTNVLTKVSQEEGLPQVLAMCALRHLKYNADSSPLIVIPSSFLQPANDNITFTPPSPIDDEFGKALVNYGSLDPDIRIDAVSALGQCNDPRVVEKLLSISRLDIEDNPQVRSTAVSCLFKHKNDSRIVKPLIEVLKTDPDDEVRSDVLNLLGNIEGENKKKHLYDIVSAITYAIENYPKIKSYAKWHLFGVTFGTFDIHPEFKWLLKQHEIEFEQ